jgi:hypothetical protein
MVTIHTSKKLNTGITLEIPKKFLENLSADGVQMVLIPCKLDSGEAGYVLKVVGGSIDLYSEGVQKVFTMWVGAMREVAIEVLTPKMIDKFFNLFAIKMKGWEKKAQRKLKSTQSKG